MHLEKIFAFSLSFTVSILSNYGGVAMTNDRASTVPSQQSTSMIGYALAIPAGLPGLSPKSDREQEHLFGAVKTVKREQINTSRVLGVFTRKQTQAISSISFNAEGNKTEEINYNGGNSIHSCSYKYNTKGRKTVQAMTQGNIHGETTYAYNLGGREIEALEQIGETTLIKRRYVATYDAQGKQITARYIEGDMELKASYRYSYDQQGRLIELATLTAEGVIYHRIVYAYDEKGNLTSEIALRPDASVYKKSLFSYDGTKKRAESFSYGDNGSEQVHMIEIFDDRGNVVEVSGFDSSGHVKGGKTIRRYEYDRAGNWIKQIVKSVDAISGKAWDEWVEERQIEYY